MRAISTQWSSSAFRSMKCFSRTSAKAFQCLIEQVVQVFCRWLRNQIEHFARVLACDIPQTEMPWINIFKSMAVRFGCVQLYMVAFYLHMRKLPVFTNSYSTVFGPLHHGC